MFEIEKHAPIPNNRAGRGRPAIYPFGLLQVGDSFLVDADAAGHARLAASAWKRNHPGWNYVSRAETSGVRFWRTA